MSVDSAEAPASASSTATKIRELFEQYRLPGVDFDAFISARKSDIDAISKATAAAYAGVQSITEKQADLLKTTLGELQAALPAAPAELGSGSGLETAVKKQAELVQTTLTRTLESMKEMAEAAGQAQSEVFKVAVERVQSTAAELRTLVATQKK
jgi:phasin family protein